MTTRNFFKKFALGALMFITAAPASALLTDPAVVWPAATDWQPYLVGGLPVIDAEGGMGNDSSNGGASFTGNTDIASAYDLAPPNGTCTNGADTQCGLATSAFTYYDDKGTPATSDDILFTRLRVNGDPGGAVGFDNFHWNVLIDITGTSNDGFKDVWIDLFGGFNGGEKADQIRLLYEDNGSNDVTNDDGAGTSAGCGGSSTTGGTFINSYLACTTPGAAACSSGGTELSHARKVACADGSGDFWVDIQVPVTDLTDGSGCYSGPTKTSSPEDFVKGTPLMSSTSQQYGLLFSTSNSNTDPLQKDFVDSDFGDAASTPVTLASFEAERSGAGVEFRWTTATETRNVGFFIEEQTSAGWVGVNKQPVFSHQMDSTQAQSYEFYAPGLASTVFRIADIDTKIRRKVNGPFELGRLYGRSAELRPIDWASIGREHQIQEARRHRATKAAEAGNGGKQKSTGVVCRFQISETGLYRVNASELASAGYDLTGLKLKAIALTRGEQSVQIRIGGGGHTWSSSSFLEFFAQAPDSMYTHDSIYQLEINPSKVARMAVETRPVPTAQAPSSYSQALFVNDDNAYMPFTPGDDPWYDTQFIARENQPVSTTYTMNVDHLAAGNSSLNLELWGITDWPAENDHHVKIFFNGQLVTDQIFDGFVSMPLNISLADGLLHNGANELRIESMGDVGVSFDMVDLNTYGLQYPRAFAAPNGVLHFSSRGRALEVSELPGETISVYRLGSSATSAQISWYRNVSVEATKSGFVARFAGDGTSRRGESQFWVVDASQFKTPRIEAVSAGADNLLTGSADYLLISHPDFIDGLAPLVAARRSNGWNPKTVNVEDIYAAYGDGSANPEAIRSYLKDAVLQMGVRAVLLVGADTFDYLDHLGLGSISFIPTLYTETRFGSKFTPSDALMADIDGDMVPDVAIGRFPVRNNFELTTLITKTLEYQNSPRAYTAVVAAGPSEERAPFTEQASSLLGNLPTYWDASSAFVDELGLSRARTTLIDAMNRGTSLVSYVGHSGPSRWSFDGLFETADIATLTNNGLPSVVDQWGCWNTYFVDPLAETMAHVFLLSPNKGAAAVIGATTIASVEANTLFAPMQQRRMVQPGTPLGEAILQAKRQLASSNPEMTEVILGSALLGDPALVVAPE